MSAPSPESGPSAGAYERPNEKWVCGLAADGQPCPFGPDPRGHCGARPECSPRRQGDRWQCTRPAHRGGPCADGPRPDGTCGRPVSTCQPVRSLRSRRGQLAFCAAALSLGVVLYVAGGQSRSSFLSPGPLTFQHGTVTHSCETCHGEPQERPAGLIHAVVSPHSAGVENRRCLECHHLGEHGTAPHGLASGRLEELTHKAHSEASPKAPLLLAAAKSGLGVPQAPDGSLVCGSCHREHQGEQFNLRFMDNQRCQACHVQQFASLAEGHPEFAHYPYHRRTAIFFDHESHIGRHFKDFARTMPGGKAPDTCADCHAPDAAGRMMLVKSFDKTCASCHLPQIEDTTLGGVRFLNLPGLDVATLREHERLSSYVDPMTALCALPGPVSSLALPLAALFRDARLVVQPPFAVGEWPAAAAGAPTPFLQLLLSADPRYAALRGALQEADLTDLRRASPEQIRAVGALLWGIKGLMYDLIRDGNGAITSRLDRLAGQRLSSEQLTLLTGDLPPSLVLDSQERWLPGLLAEVPAWRTRSPLPSGAGAEPAVAVAAVSGRWRRQDSDCSLQYLPRRHQDLFLQHWLNLSGEQYAGPRGPFFGAVFDDVASPYSPGRCTKCHGVQAAADGVRTVSWWTARPERDRHAFTTFAHGPHFDLGRPECRTCHVLDRDGKYEASFRKPDHTLNTDAANFASNFVGMKKAGCVACHTAGRAGDGCLLCHNYHVGQFAPFPAPPQPLHDFRAWSPKPQEGDQPARVQKRSTSRRIAQANLLDALLRDPD